MKIEERVHYGDRKKSMKARFDKIQCVAEEGVRKKEDKEEVDKRIK